MRYTDLPANYRTAIETYVNMVINEAPTFLQSIGCTLPDNWGVTDCLVCGSYGLAGSQETEGETDAYGSYPNDPQFSAYVDEIDLRFILTHQMDAVTVPAMVNFDGRTINGNKAKYRLLNYMKFYLPYVIFAQVGITTMPLQLDINIHTADLITGRAEMPNWVQSEQTGFSIRHGEHYGKGYKDAQDYIDNSPHPMWFPFPKNLPGM